MEKKKILSAKNLSREYPGVQALDDVSFDLYEGEVLAIVGENGAGKSTLIKMISGADKPDSGVITINGEEYTSIRPAQSKALGIATIYQEFNVFPDLSVAENIFIGEEKGYKVFADRKSWKKKAEEIYSNMHFAIDVNKLVNQLTTAYVQMVEIAKALVVNAKIIIMDEPTACLSNDEVNMLFEIIQRLKEQGVTVIYISHRLGEVFEISDRIFVMRDGHKVAHFDTGTVKREDLVFHMVNRKIEDKISDRKRHIGKVVLEAKHLCGDGVIKVDDISFELHEGEVLGLGGLVGAGRTEVSRLLFGADKLVSGEILIDGKKVNITSPKVANKLGIGLVPEDRKQHGTILDMSIRNNVSLPIINILSKFGFIRFKTEESIVNEQKEALSIKTSSLNQLTSNLSGGNQQKVVLAKWLARKSRILVLDEPTRGVDVGAKMELYKLINNLAEQGHAILLITTEMEELIGLSDRLLILSEGKSMGFLEKECFSQQRVMELASGNK